MQSGAHGLGPGTIFANDYRIVRPLASGGMGVVYVAHQISTARDRALKIMLGDLVGSQDLMRRFEQEARVGAQIDSEHVVEVVGAGIDAATGSPWLAMELLQGEDFAAFLARSGPLAPNVVLDVFEQLAHAVGAAHAKQIVHRDLKPENVFLAQSRRAGASFIVKVLDFGIAKLLGQAKTSRTAAMGTPLWMAPEQTQHGGRINAAVDVWALGLIAFRALTGRHFWMSAEDPDASSMMILREIAFEPIPPASVRAAQLGAPPLPPGFDAWFARCVVRASEERFQNANDMFAELRSVLSGGGNWVPSAASASEQRTSYAQPFTGAMAPAGSGMTELPASAPRAESPTIVARKQTQMLGFIIGGVVALAALGGVAYLATSSSGTSASKSEAARHRGEDDGDEERTKTKDSEPAPRSASTTDPAAGTPPTGTMVASDGSAPIPHGEDAPSGTAKSGPAPTVATTQPIPTSPNAATGSLSLNSIPASTATVDGKNVGMTPQSNVSVPAGTHVVTFSHPDYESKSVTVTVGAGERKTASAKLQEKPKSEPPKTEPASGGSGEFDRGAASASLSSAAGRAQSCKLPDGPTGTTKVNVTFAPSGQVTSASVGAPFTGTPTGACIAGVFRGAKVPPFSGQPVTVSKTVSIR